MQFKLDKNGLFSWTLLALTGSAASWIGWMHQQFSWMYLLPSLVAVLLILEQRPRALQLFPLLWRVCFAVSLLALLASGIAMIMSTLQ